MRPLKILCFCLLAAVSQAAEAPVEALPLSPSASPLVLLDPAHGGEVPGIRHEQFTEAGYVLDLALKTAEFLRGQGIRARLTREGNEALNLGKRVVMGNESGAAAFVSLHMNHSFNLGSRAPRLFIAPDYGPARPGQPLRWKNSQRDSLEASRELASAIAFNMVEKKRRRRAVQSLPMGIFRGLAIPGVVVELGFVSDTADLENFLVEESIETYADKIARSLVAWLELPWQEEETRKEGGIQ